MIPIAMIEMKDVNWFISLCVMHCGGRCAATPYGRAAAPLGRTAAQFESTARRQYTTPLLDGRAPPAVSRGEKCLRDRIYKTPQRGARQNISHCTLYATSCWRTVLERVYFHNAYRILSSRRKRFLGQLPVALS
jgi:hypothetical protein